MYGGNEVNMALSLLYLLLCCYSPNLRISLIIKIFSWSLKPTKIKILLDNNFTKISGSL